MRNPRLILLIALFAMPALFAQIKIGDNPQAISPTSVLELESNDRVLVITRINTAQMDAIVPNQGAMVYNTDTQCIHYYDGAQWVNLCDSAGFEVADNSIKSNHIEDFSITGDDIQGGAIGPGKLQDQSVTQEKLGENSVGAFALDNANISLGDFSNDPGFITAADLDIVSAAAGNVITENADGAFYDDQTLQDDIAANTTFINAHITADADTNANNEIQTLSINSNILTLTNPSGNNVITLPAGGNPTDELQDVSFNTTTNILTLTNSATPAGGSVDLSTLAGGGSQNLTSVLTQGNDAGTSKIIGLGAPTNPNDAATKAYVDANIGGNQNLASVLAQGTDGGAAQIKNILDPTLAQDAATKAYVDANIGGNQNLGQVLAQGTDGGAALIKNILDPVDPQDAATRAYVLATVASGGALTDGSILIGGAGDVAQQLAISGDATLDNLGILTIADDAIKLNMIAPPVTPAEGDIMVWDNTALEWVIDSQAGEHTATTANAIFYANSDPANLGKPITVDDNLNPNDDGGFIWDTSARPVGASNTYGALIIGKQAGSPNLGTHAKVVMIERIANSHATQAGLAYPLQIQNENGTNSGNAAAGILFAVEPSGEFGKGSLAYERKGAWGIGDFHFLQNDQSNNTLPTIADKAFTVKNNGDIRLYGGIDVDGTATGLGGNNEVLTSDGAGGLQWTAKNAVTLDTETDDGLTHQLAASGYDINVDNSTIEIFGDALKVKADGITATEIGNQEVGEAQLEDLSVTTAKIEPSVTNGEVLLTTGGAVVWGAAPAGAVSSDGVTIIGNGTTTDLSVPNNGINTAQIATDAVTADKIADGAISGGLGGDIVDGSITASDLSNDSVDKAEIRIDAVGQSEIETGGVATDEILDGTITNIDIAGAAAIDGAKILPNFTVQINAALGMTTGADILMNGNLVVPDYVFQKYFEGDSELNKNYNFSKLSEIEAFVKENHHLPGITSADQAKKDGAWNLSSSNLLNLEKIEELFLHTIEQENKIKTLQTENATLSSQMEAMKKDLEEIKTLLKKVN